MDGEKLIQVSFQIPPSALDSLSRLAEQLRMLTESITAQAAPASRAAGSEREENSTFDPERFQALLQGSDVQPPAASTEVSDTADAKAVSGEVPQMGDAKAVSASISQAGDAEEVSTEIRSELPDAESAGGPLPHRSEDAADRITDPYHTLLEERDIPLPPAEAPQANSLSTIPAVQAEAETDVPDASEAVRDAEREMPEAEGTRADAEDREPLPAVVHGEVSGGVESPSGAGLAVQAQPEMPQSRWNGVTEELVSPGPAPLTAEAVSLAFERDGRRYDNGFPLY